MTSSFSHTCRRGLHISTLHPQLLYLLGRAGCIELLLDLLRHHLENETVVALALQVLDLLLSVREKEIWNVHVDRFLGYQPTSSSASSASHNASKKGSPNKEVVMSQSSPYGSYRNKNDPYMTSNSGSRKLPPVRSPSIHSPSFSPSFSPNFSPSVNISRKSFKQHPNTQTLPKQPAEEEETAIPLSLSLVYLLLEKHSRISREVVVFAMSILLTRLSSPSNSDSGRIDGILGKIRSPLLLTKANDTLIDRILSGGKLMMMKSKVCMSWCEVMERLFVGSNGRVNGVMMLPTAIVISSGNDNDVNNDDVEEVSFFLFPMYRCCCGTHNLQ